MQLFSRNIDDYPEGIVLVIDKPYLWTSADVIRKVKYAAIRHFGKKNLKVGHAGTLDPLATGILLVCIGKATKRAEEFQSHDKEYLASVSFGATTPSYDLEKDIDNVCPLNGVNENSIRSILPQFMGEQMQVAPLFSAKSIDGVRAYETARKLYRQGRLDEASDLIKASPIKISRIELEAYRETPVPYLSEEERAGSRINVADVSSYTLKTAGIRISCSKGTYIRALARDLGEALGSGAFLSGLRRTASGSFRIEDAMTLPEVLESLGAQQ